MDIDQPTLSTAAAMPKRPYAAPTLVVHGDVQALTQVSKVGTDPDTDGGGSFIPVGSG